MGVFLVRDTGIEPVSQPWEGRILPLNQSHLPSLYPGNTVIV